MKKLTIATLALSASFAMPQQSRAYLNYPWCNTASDRGLECHFASREECAQDGRNRGFGGYCRPNPFYNPKLPSVIEVRPPKNAGERHKA
jgi:Protein of unknown function (DUF3551)